MSGMMHDDEKYFWVENVETAHQFYTVYPNIYIYTLWLFNIAMENPHF